MAWRSGDALMEPGRELSGLAALVTGGGSGSALQPRRRCARGAARGGHGPGGGRGAAADLVARRHLRRRGGSPRRRPSDRGARRARHAHEQPGHRGAGHGQGQPGRGVAPRLRLSDAIRAAGATSWTIWRSGLNLFHVIECVDFVGLLALDPLVVNQAWQERLTLLLDVPHDDSSAGAAQKLRVVWRL
jgi:L-rhamnose mutarotase